MDEPSSCAKDTESVSESSFLVGELEGVSNLDSAGCDRTVPSCNPDSARAVAGPASHSVLPLLSTCCGLGILDFLALSGVADGRIVLSRDWQISEAGVDAEVTDWSGDGLLVYGETSPAASRRCLYSTPSTEGMKGEALAALSNFAAKFITFPAPRLKSPRLLMADIGEASCGVVKDDFWSWMCASLCCGNWALDLVFQMG